MFGVGISFLINVGLDYLFIMVWHWGVFGAALATGGACRSRRSRTISAQSAQASR